MSGGDCVSDCATVLREIKLLRLMVMVEYSANTPTCTLGDFACALRGTDADVLASDGSAFGDIASGVEWVKCDKVPRTFPNALGRCSSALGGSFTDISSASTDVAAGAALMGLLGGTLGCAGRLRLGLVLVVLAEDGLAADSKCECEERDRWFCEFGTHGLNLTLVRFDVSRDGFQVNDREIRNNPNAGFASPYAEEFVSSG